MCKKLVSIYDNVFTTMQINPFLMIVEKGINNISHHIENVIINTFKKKVDALLHNIITIEIFV